MDFFYGNGEWMGKQEFWEETLREWERDVNLGTKKYPICVPFKIQDRTVMGRVREFAKIKSDNHTNRKLFVNYTLSINYPKNKKNFDLCYLIIKILKLSKPTYIIL